MLNAYANAEKLKADAKDDPAVSMVFDSEISPQTLYDSFSALQDPSSFLCPHCKKCGLFRPAGYYRRYFFNSLGQIQENCRLRIKVFRCACGHKHALMPGWLCPYSSFSMPFLEEILLEYFGASNKNKSHTAKKFGLSYRQVYHVISTLLTEPAISQTCRTLYNILSENSEQQQEQSAVYPKAEDPADLQSEQPAEAGDRFSDEKSLSNAKKGFSAGSGLSLNRMLLEVFSETFLFLLFINLYLSTYSYPFLASIPKAGNARNIRDEFLTVKFQPLLFSSA